MKLSTLILILPFLLTTGTAQAESFEGPGRFTDLQSALNAKDLSARQKSRLTRRYSKSEARAQKFRSLSAFEKEIKLAPLRAKLDSLQKRCDEQLPSGKRMRRHRPFVVCGELGLGWVLSAGAFYCVDGHGKSFDMITVGLGYNINVHANLLVGAGAPEHGVYWGAEGGLWAVVGAGAHWFYDSWEDPAEFVTIGPGVGLGVAAGWTIVGVNRISD